MRHGRICLNANKSSGENDGCDEKVVERGARGDKLGREGEIESKI
jgi:hypothetical protein